MPESSPEDPEDAVLDSFCSLRDSFKNGIERGEEYPELRQVSAHYSLLVDLSGCTSVMLSCASKWRHMRADVRKNAVLRISKRQLTLSRTLVAFSWHPANILLYDSSWY